MGRMNNTRTYLLDEPELVFGHGQFEKDPRVGLTLFGPCDLNESYHPEKINYGVIGTELGINKFERFAEIISQSIITESENHMLWVPFPGFSSAYHAKFPPTPLKYLLDEKKLNHDSRLFDPYERSNKLVDYYIEKLEIIRKLDQHIGVVICVIPDFVYENCRPKSKVKDGVGKKRSKKMIKSSKAKQLDFMSTIDPGIYDHSVDFRRQLKARALEIGIPIQLIRESTLRPNDENELGKRGLTPLSDRAWNLSNAIYYKCGGKPWKLSSLREGVCYVGITFKRTDDKNTACCAAQMFLDSGDGIVFLGEYGPWYSVDKQFHLPREKAYNLLAGTLRTYEQLHGKKLKEIFLHSHSTIDEEEFQGYKDATPEEVKITGIRIRKEYSSGLKLFRHGKYPVLRGAVLLNNDKSCFLWSNGYKPKIESYDGWEVPKPIRVDIEHGENDILRVAQDVLSLTKLNYNACHLSESMPITIGYSSSVGEILVNSPKHIKPRPNFKFYI